MDVICYMDYLWEKGYAQVIGYVKMELLASQSDAHRIAPHRDPTHPNPIPNPLIALKQERPMM